MSACPQSRNRGASTQARSGCRQRTHPQPTTTRALLPTTLGTDLRIQHELVVPQIDAEQSRVEGRLRNHFRRPAAQTAAKTNHPLHRNASGSTYTNSLHIPSSEPRPKLHNNSRCRRQQLIQHDLVRRIEPPGAHFPPRARRAIGNYTAHKLRGAPPHPCAR